MVIKQIEKNAEKKFEILYNQTHSVGLTKFLLVFCFVTFVFSLMNLTHGNVVIAVVEAIDSLVAGVLYLIRARVNLSIRQNLTLILIAILTYAFMFFPAVGDSAYLWMMAFPIFTLFLVGTKHGLRWIVSFGVVATITGVFLWKLGVDLYWSWNLGLYFILDYSIVCFLSYCFSIQQELYSHKLFQALLEKEKQNVELTRLSAERIEADKKYKEVFKNIQDCLYRTDIEGRLIFASPSITTIMCCDADELIGENISDYYVDPNGRKCFLNLLKDSPDGKINGFEVQMRRKDNEVIWLSANSHLIYDKNGNMNGIEGTLRDITKVKEVEASLRTLSQAFEFAGEAMLLTDKRGTIEVVNKAFTSLMGYSSKEVIGKNASILNSGKQNKDLYKGLWKDISTGKVWSKKIIDKKKDGSFVPVNLTIAAIYDDKENITHFIGVQSDLTEIVELEERYQQAQKMEAVGTLVGGIAHDFNNILAAISGSTYLAKRKPTDSQKHFEIIETQTFRATEMIKKLLAFVRKDTRVMSEISLCDLLSQSKKLFKFTVSENIQFNLEICQNPMFIQGDYTQLQQVLINLINNARDAVIGVATPVISIAVDFPSLSNRLKKKYPKVDLDGYARISIADNGHGIDKDYMGKIFDPFFTLKEVGKGTGLGLAMVKGTIESHGGFIDVDTNLEAGTKFSILLPLANADAHTGVNVNTGTDVVYHKEESLILLVDDENDVREVNRAILEDFGYTVIEAVDGLQAIEKFSDFEGKIKLVMMDVVMPRMGGIKAAERIREISSSVPIIFATGYDRTQVLGESEASLEKCSIITKPFKMNELSQMISQMID